LLQAKLRYVCSPPGIDGWRNVALLHERLGLWQLTHDMLRPSCWLP
jgi:hypothetical protein